MINPFTAKVHTMGTWASELEYGAVEEHWLIWWIRFSFRPGGWPGTCVLFTWGRDGSRLHYGKKAGRWRQCYDLLRNLRSWHVTLTHTTTYKYCCRPWTLLHGNVFPDGDNLFQKYKCNVWAMFEEHGMQCLRNMEKCSMCCLGLQTLQILQSF